MRGLLVLTVILLGVGLSLIVPEDSPVPPQGEIAVSDAGLSAQRWFGEEVSPWGQLRSADLPRLRVSDRALRPGDAIWIFLEGVKGDPEYWVESDLPLWSGTLAGLAQGAGGLFAVDYRVDPGHYEVRVGVKWECGSGWSRKMDLEVVPFQFQVQRLTVSPTLLAVRSPHHWEQDRAHIDRALSQTHDSPLWEGPFIMPAEGRLTTDFGVIRYINGVESGRHSGLDIAAPTGTPVIAAARGRVALAEELNVLGRTVILDHGLNLFSWYYHLHEIGVEEGDLVAIGQEIGTIGSTGFSTGPHLHWSVSLGRTYISPWLMMERSLGPGLDPDLLSIPALGNGS